MRIVKASLWRIARERVYLAAIALSWALALVLAVLVPSGDASAGTLAVISENLPDYMGSFFSSRFLPAHMCLAGVCNHGQ